MIKAVIFDMDGLIVDTESVESIALEKMLRSYGKIPQYRSNGLVHIIGLAGNQFWIDLKNDYNLEMSIEEIRDKKRTYFEEILREELTPMPGFMKLINELHAKKYEIALASNRYEKHIHLVLDNLKVKHLFKLIVGPSDKRKHKPHPDIYLHTMRELGVQAEECIILEDSPPGIEAGKAAGSKVIAIPNQFTKEQDLSKADIILDSLDKVNLDLIQSL